MTAKVIVDSGNYKQVTLGIQGPPGPQGIQGIQGPPGPTDYTLLTNKPDTFPPAPHTHVKADITDLGDAAGMDYVYVDEGDKRNALNIAKVNFGLNSHIGATRQALNGYVVDTLDDETGINKSASRYFYDAAAKAARPNNVARSYPSPDVFDGGILTSTEITAQGTIRMATGEGIVTDIIPAMTSNTAPAPYAITAYPGGAGWAAFDNNAASEWVPSYVNITSDTYKLTIDLGSAKQITAYSLTASSAAGNNTAYANAYPRDFKLEGSDDNATWIQLDSQVSQTNWAKGERRQYALSAPATYRYFRLSVSYYTNQTSGYYLRLAEMELLAPGYPALATYESLPISLDGFGDILASFINWSSTTPTGTGVTVATTISQDAGTTWGAWQDVTNGGAATAITSAGAGFQFKFRVTLTSDGSATAELLTLALQIGATCTLIWNPESVQAAPGKAWVTADYQGQVNFFLTRDGGATWTAIAPDTLTDISAQPTGTSVALKAELASADAQVNAVAWGWI